MKMNNYVAVDLSSANDYPKSPFDPPEIYPEFSSLSHVNHIDHNNKVYATVRSVLQYLELDISNLGTQFWNPFIDIVKSGDHIVIKPNLVYDKHPLGNPGILCAVSHASVVRPIIDYILLAVGNDCHITICDVPLQNADWNNLIILSGFKDLQEFYSHNNIPIDLLDLRSEISIKIDDVISKRLMQKRDPRGYKIVDLGTKSELMPIIQFNKKFRITNYQSRDLFQYHNKNKNEYCIPRTVLDSDVFINVPKLKTHRKSGISCALKNLIGINGDKRYIVHHRQGGVKNGGDEYPVFKPTLILKHRIWEFCKKHKFTIPFARAIKWIYLGKMDLSEYSLNHKKEIMEGSWSGNDTIWRCILDINKIIFYSNKNGMIIESPQRKYLCIVDGIISGEGEGPMLGTPKNIGVIIAGSNPVAVDKICADIMGFDYQKIPQIAKAFESKGLHLIDFSPDLIQTNLTKMPNFNFMKSYGWNK